MTRALTRTSFHSSGLLRTLTDLACLPAPGTGAAFAQKLGLWVDYTHAIALCAVHNARPLDVPAWPTVGAQATAAQTEFARQRSLLEHTIHTAPLPPMDLATAAFEPYHRYYLGQQRELDLKLPPLRARVRDLLAQASPALQQLAALDAVFEDVLEAREARLLATVPQLLKSRFSQLANGPAPQPPGNWLLRFRQELQSILLAELDLRLQPTLGLLEALACEPHSEPPFEAPAAPCTV